MFKSMLKQNNYKKMIKKEKTNKGFSIIEVILAAAIFVIFSGGAVALVLHSFSSTRLAKEQLIANNYASEGIDAVKSIGNQSYASLVNTVGVGVSVTGGGVWTFSGTNNTFDKYTRVITVSDVQRDGSNNVVASGGTLDANTKKITSTVTWNFSPNRNKTITLTSYITNWQATIIQTFGGMLVYADTTAGADRIAYRELSADGTSWSTATSVVDVDGASTNRAPRAVKVYASSTRDEKILVSRHYNGTAQTIYAQVYNGSTWGNLVTLATWNATTNLTVQNFDGVYLNNGTFMVVYADNTAIPKYRTWNGTSWGAQTSMTTLASVPVQVETKVRPNTNEVMAVFVAANSATISQYYSGSAWSAITTHASALNTLTRRYIAFDWSPNNNTKGLIAYTNSATDRSLDTKIWTANGTGGGAWSAVASTANQGATTAIRLGDATVSGGTGINFFMVCNNNTTPSVICYKLSFTPSVVIPTNQTIAAATSTGTQRTFSAMYNPQSSTNGLVVYSDNSNIPKYKLYTESTTTWAATASNITTTPYTLGIVNAVEMIPNATTNEIMVVLADANLDTYSIVWNANTNTFYTTPTGKVFTRHGTLGSNTADYYFDFAWDAF